MSFLLSPFSWMLVFFHYLVFLALAGSRMAGRLAGQFLLSPWGLIVPITVLAALLLSMQIDKNQRELANQYGAELEYCPIDKIPVLIDALVQFGERGIPSLVRALQSEREIVFNAILETLQQEMERLETEGNIEARNKYYRQLSKALCEEQPNFTPLVSLTAQQLIRRILKNLATSDRYRGNQFTSAVASADSQQATINCDQFILAIRRLPPNFYSHQSTTIPGTRETVAQFECANAASILIAANGRPINRPDANILLDSAPTLLRSPFFGGSTSRFDEFEQTGEMMAASSIDSTKNQQILQQNTNVGLSERGTLPTEIGSDLMAAQMAKPIGKVANEYVAPFEKKDDAKISDVDQLNNVASDYLLKNQERQSNQPEKRERSSEILLPSNLREMPLVQVPGLSSSELMRVLHHPDERYVSEARRTLVAREGFQPEHLKLAFRLFHPMSSVREELLSLIRETPGIQSNVWLVALLDDPNSEIRYSAASLLSTANDPTLLRLLVEKGKQDTDSRIVRLSEQISQQQMRRR
ncbi:MAG: hypothetical protein ACRCUY_12765 [Thermoguttaceae bacterium]